MSYNKKDEEYLRDIDEAEANTYRQVFGIFDKDNGDFLKIDVKENAIDNKITKVQPISYDDKTSELKEDSFGQRAEIENEIDKFIKELSEKEISSMVITIKINGIVEEYVNDEKASEKYLSKEAQIEKIKKTIKEYKNIVIVYSEKELQKLQEDFKKEQERLGASVKGIDSKDKEDTKKSEVITQVYIRISEEDYLLVKSLIEKENIKITANKVKDRNDKSGINMIIQFVDADRVRSILKQNYVHILQDVDGNIDWEDIKVRSDKFENISLEQLREFQSKNNDKFDYIAFRKDDTYTIFVDRKCDITIGDSGRKTLKQIEAKVEDHKNKIINNSQSNKNKVKNSKEERE